MKFRRCAARFIIRSAFLVVLLCGVRAQAQVSANPSADGALADIGSPNLSATPDASQGVPSGSGSSRSLLRQQAAAGSRAISSRALSSTARLSQQKALEPYTAAGVARAGSGTNSASHSLYGTIATPPIRAIGFKSGAGRSLGTGLSSGFSTGTLLGSSPAGGSIASPSASSSGPRSFRKPLGTGSAAVSLRGRPARGLPRNSRLEGLSQKYTFQAPRSRYDKAAPESSFRGRRSAEQP